MNAQLAPDRRIEHLPSRSVVDAIVQAPPGRGVLALVLETAGSTYARPGSIALFGVAQEPSGWLSGGCLEAEIAEHAAAAEQAASLGWLEIDTRDDSALFSGSAAGCRGRLRIALLPLSRCARLPAMLRHWLATDQPLQWCLSRDGRLALYCGAQHVEWALPQTAKPWPDSPAFWQIDYPAPPCVLLFGAGPETPWLAAALRALSWRSLLIERRPRWQGRAWALEQTLELSPAVAMTQPLLAGARAALVMHHNFELDREALLALGPSRLPFIGLLGPTRRRDDLFKLLPQPLREALRPRLRSPVGLPLGGYGPEAIALSIVAELQPFRDAG